MKDAVVAQNIGKRFRRYHLDRPATLHEALMRGFRKLNPSECFWGLHDVSFRVEPGSMVGVVGRNGAGKSTLLRLIGGVGRPECGSIQVNGRVGALLTLGAGFHPELTGRENIFVNGVIGGLTRREVAARFDSIVAFSELEEYMDTPLRAYSTGMQMRMAFSIAIHSQPDILLIDEVLAVGDLAFQRKCLGRIFQLKANGCAIILVSHDVTMVLQLCDHSLWLRAGELAAIGRPELVIPQYLAEADAKTASYAVAGAPMIAQENMQPEQGSQGPAESPQVEIIDTRLLDFRGEPAAGIDSGAPLSVEIAYRTARPVEALNFHVYLRRADGVLCCESGTLASGSSLFHVHGEGRMVLHFEQLDLNGGHYYVDVGAFERDPAAGHVYREKMRWLTVRTTGSGTAILNPPHRWEARSSPAGEQDVPPLLQSANLSEPTVRSL